MRKPVVLFAAALSGLGGVWALAQEPVPDPLAQPRAAYEQRATPAQAKAAVDLFGKALKADPRSYEAAWEGARAC